MEKSVAADGVDQFVGVPLPLGVEDCTDIVEFNFLVAVFRVFALFRGVAFLRIYGGEAGEVMPAFDQAGGGDQLLFGERIRVVVDVTRLKWRRNCSTIDVVAVGFGGG